MAIEYCRVTYHTRRQGHSAVEAAAYRSANQLHDERIDVLYNYENRTKTLGIESFIMLPEGPDEKYLNREYLWNKVEAAELRKDSQLAKDYVIALPKELPKYLQIDITKQYVDEQFVSRGIPADVSMHFEDENPHAHILVTTRRLEKDGFSKYKARDLEPIVSKGFVVRHEELGKEWRDFQNKYFEKKDMDIKVDQNHILSQLHEGRNSDKGAYYLHKQNEVRAEQSKQIALTDPQLFLHVLAGRNTVFTKYDIESLAYKSTDTLEEFNQVVEQALKAENIVNLGVGFDGRERYSTKYAIHQEYKLDRTAKVINVRNSHAVSPWEADLIINQKALSKEQEKAVKHLTGKSDLAVVIGKPGTGKTYMLNTAKEIWQHDGYRVLGATVSGIASENLQRETGINSRTVASWDRYFDRGFKFTNKDVLVVDEAGMVNLYQMKLMMEQAKSSSAKIVLIGDPDQLNPIGPGAPLRLIAEQFGYSEMTDIQRQKIVWQRDITYNLALGDVNAIDVYKEKGNLVMLSSPEKAKEELIDRWSDNIREKRIDNSIIMAHRNSDVSDLNIMARAKLIKSGTLKGEETVIKTNTGNMKVLQGERILFTKNDRSAGVKNGNFATVLNVSNDKLEVMISGKDVPVSIDLKKYDNISYGYAATVHKLQGVTVDKSYVYYGGKYWNKNLNLVALSRHREDIKIFADTRTHRNYDILKQRLNRAEFKDSVLNYPVAFSLRYGVDPDSVIGKVLNKFNEVIEKVQDAWLWLSNKQSYLEIHQGREENIRFELNGRAKNLINEYTRNLEQIEMLMVRREQAIKAKDMSLVECADDLIRSQKSIELEIIINLAKSQEGVFAQVKKFMNNSLDWPVTAISKEQTQKLIQKYEDVLENKVQQQVVSNVQKEVTQEAKKSQITKDGKLFISKEEKMELLHLLRNMVRRYNVGEKGDRYSVITTEYRTHKKLIDKITQKIDIILDKVKNSEWLKTVPILIEEKKIGYTPVYNPPPLIEQLKPIIKSVKNNNLPEAEYQVLLNRIQKSIRIREEIKKTEAVFLARTKGKSRGMSY